MLDATFTLQKNICGTLCHRISKIEPCRPDWSAMPNIILQCVALFAQYFIYGTRIKLSGFAEAFAGQQWKLGELNTLTSNVNTACYAGF